MYKGRNKSVPSFFLPMLYLSFSVFLLGCLVGMISAVRCGTEYSVSASQNDSVLSVIWDCLVYHIAVLAFVRLPMGPLPVLLVLFIRGCVLSGAVAVMHISGSSGIREIWMMCGLPVMLQLPSLFYLAAMGLRFKYCRRRGRVTVDEQTAKGIKRDLLWCGLSLALCIIVECVFN